MDNSNPTICLWITFDGGEGVRSVGDNCGYILYTEKAKIGKGATPPLPRYEKKVLVHGIQDSPIRIVSISAAFATPTRVWTVALPRELPKSIHTLVGVSGLP